MFTNKLLSISMLTIAFAVHPAFARISILSPWGLEDRQLTAAGRIHQSLGFQFGINGVTPPSTDLDSNFIAIPYQLTYGAANKIEAGGAWGLLNARRKDKSSQFGIADLAIAGKYRFLDPDRAARTPGLDMEAGLSFPTASFAKGLGTGGLGILVGTGLVLPLDPARAFFGLGYRWYTENSDDVQIGSIFSYNLGMTVPIKTSQVQFKSYKNMETFSLTTELKGFNHAHNKVSGTKAGSAPDELYLAPGILWQVDQSFEFTGSLLIGLTGDSSDIGMNLAFRF